MLKIILVFLSQWMHIWLNIVERGFMIIDFVSVIVTHHLLDRVLFICCVHFTEKITEQDDESEGKTINQSQLSLRLS